MSAGIDCCQSACAAVETVSIPGVEGEEGTPGTNGINAYTLTTADFVIPAVSANVSITVVENSWMAVGQKIFISDSDTFGTFQVVSKTGTTQVTLTYLDYIENTETGETVTTGAMVVPSGAEGPSVGALPTVITDNSGGTASNTIAATVGIHTLAFHINLVALTTAAADLMTNYVLGYRFKILSVDFCTNTLGTGAGASQTINLEIGTTNLTGGVVLVTLASTDTLGEMTAGSAVTANNVGTAADSLSIEVAAGGTVFTAGQGVLLVKIQNMDSADAFASLSDHVSDLIVALT